MKEISTDVKKQIWVMLKEAQFVDDSPEITEALERLEYDGSENYLNLLGGE